MRPRKKPTEGMLAQYGGIDARQDGKFTEGMAASLKSAINSIISTLNGGLTFGAGGQSSSTGNFDGYCKDVIFPSVADTEMRVLHELGRAPRFFIVAMKDRAGDVYVSSYSSWGTQAIFLKSSVADLTATLLIF